MSEISFAPMARELEVVRGDTVPPITIPLVDEVGDSLNTSLYVVTAEVIGPDGTSTPATIQASGGDVVFSMTPAQSEQVAEGSRWCVQLATPDQSDVRTVVLGPVNLILK